MFKIAKNLYRALFSPEISVEALEAYYNRLPSTISVKWHREMGYIVGEVQVEDNQPFYTQAKNGKQFIEMVNEALMVVYEVPKDYHDVLKSFRKFIPRNPEELKKLYNNDCLEGTLGVSKEKLQTA
jgi:hypothetical protein